MNTQKLNTLAHTIINYSLHLKENSKVLIDFTKEASPLVEELIKEGKKVGAIMSLDMYDSKLACLLADTNTAERIELIKKRIQPAIDVANRHFPICKYRIDSIGNIVGYLPMVKKSKIYFTMKEIET